MPVINAVHNSSHGPAHGDDHQHSWFNGASAGLMRPPDSLRDLLIGSLKGACISSEDGCFWRVFGLLSAMVFDGFWMVFDGFLWLCVWSVSEGVRAWFWVRLNHGSVGRMVGFSWGFPTKASPKSST